jgi:hypothetical protein
VFDNKTHVRLILYSSMCAGAKVELEKKMMKRLPKKEMKSRV